MGHDGVGRVEDVAGRAVVLLELHHRSAGVVLLEVEDVADVGAAPRVDGLVVVAHHHEVLVLAGQKARDLVLGAVRVLILVDADVAEALLVLLENVGVVAQEAIGVDEQVVEVHGVGAGQAALKLLIHARSHLLGRGVGTSGEVRRVEELVFRRGDLGTHGIQGKALLVDAQVGHDGLDETLGIVVVVNGKRVAVAQAGAVDAQHAHAHGVERAHPHAAHAPALQEALQALLHLAGGLVGKGDGEDLPGHDAQVLQHVGDAVRQHARLARAGACQHEQRALHLKHGTFLRGVERVDVYRHETAFLRRRRQCGANVVLEGQSTIAPDSLSAERPMRSRPIHV